MSSWLVGRAIHNVGTNLSNKDLTPSTNRQPCRRQDGVYLNGKVMTTQHHQESHLMISRSCRPQDEFVHSFGGKRIFLFPHTNLWTAHPSSLHKNLYPYNIATNSSHIVSTTQIRGFWNHFWCQINRKKSKIVSMLHEGEVRSEHVRSFSCLCRPSSRHALPMHPEAWQD